MQVETLKQNIIDQIKSIEDLSKLQEIDSVISKISDSGNEVLKKLAKPMRKRLDIEEIKKEQNFKPIDKEAFFKEIDKLNVQESIEDLIKMI